VAQFSKLQNCTVIEGHLQIVLIDNGTSMDFENITFPKLREITDYFLMFRIMGLQSLSKLFPNLSVIRGRVLLHNYAFVIYEMLHLQEMGLHSLTNIIRGDIRIEKNPNLCFVDTIDWSRIARNYLISGNKDPFACPNCPEKCQRVSARRNDGKFIGDSFNRICWSPDTCQRTCKIGALFIYFLINYLSLPVKLVLNVKDKIRPVLILEIVVPLSVSVVAPGIRMRRMQRA